MSNTDPGSKQKYDCDRCGFTFYLLELNEQKGYLVCDECVDDPSPVNDGGDRGD